MFMYMHILLSVESSVQPFHRGFLLIYLKNKIMVFKFYSRMTQQKKTNKLNPVCMYIDVQYAQIEDFYPLMVTEDKTGLHIC